MAFISLPACRIRAVCSSVPERLFDNCAETTEFAPEEVDKVVKMAGVRTRHLASERTCSSDLCVAAARHVLDQLDWTPASVEALIFVTQTPDYLLPSTACLAQHRLGLTDTCAAFDVGLGCSGYPYGLWLAAMMLTGGGLSRILLLHGETPSRFAAKSDRAVALLFGDAGSATAIEAWPGSDGAQWWFSLHSDGSGWRDLILEGGGFRNRESDDPRFHCVAMDGAKIFNFTLKRVPSVVEETLRQSGNTPETVDYFIFHQSNLFIMRHLAKVLHIPEAKLPLTIQRFGSVGGPSVPLTLAQGGLERPLDRALRLLIVGYGVGLSWGTALVSLPPDALLDHLVVRESTE
ncbi:MAG TPA: ketoacyl-ACP synthase III [Verrucomicrobiota bacterium]|nr:ketoacyl-ACP synthase III [Verrucomicrobiota bacterium]